MYKIPKRDVFTLDLRDTPWKKELKGRVFKGKGLPPPIIQSDDSQYIIKSTEDHEIQVFLNKSEQVHNRFKIHTGWISSFFLSPTNKYLVSGGYDRSVVFIDFQEKKVIKELKCKAYVSSVAINPDLTIIAAGCSDGTIQLWDIKNDYQQYQILVGIWIKFVGFVKDCELLVSLSNKPTVSFWDLKSFKEKVRIDVKCAEILSFNVKDRGKYFVLASDDLRFWVYKLKFIRG